MIKALNLSCRDAAEKLEAKDKANGEALAILNKDLSSADKALASTTSELLFSKNKLAISEDTLQVLVAEIANVKDAESACRDSLQRQKVWFGLVLAKLLRILKKKENSTALAISLVEDSLQAHETLQ
jgi:septal ring factor EnvC (AmiA/AmiB activator)